MTSCISPEVAMTSPEVVTPRLEVMMMSPEVTMASPEVTMASPEVMLTGRLGPGKAIGQFPGHIRSFLSEGKHLTSECYLLTSGDELEEDLEEGSRRSY